MDREDLSGVLWFIIILVVCVISIRAFSISQDRKACEAFERYSDRETDFVKYTAFNWDCLTPSKDGKMISTSLLRETTD